MTQEKLLALLGTWGRPPDLPAKIAVAIALVFLLAAVLGRGLTLLGLGPVRLGTRRFLAITGLAAALLSVAYTAVYLRGGPRIIDATTYWLQGRALADGDLRFAVPFPSASFRGRFLLGGEDGTIAGIFPPGQPLLLALGFALRAPMIIGPLLAAAIVVATYRLTRALAADLLEPRSAEIAARTSAIASVVCAALRYHTADTMAHGTTALAIAIALERALAASRGSLATRRTAALGLGAALGLVVATRPVSALAIAVVAALLVKDLRLVARVALAALPGVALLALAQHAATGHWLASSQRAYYAVADGPTGCFRWGFGSGVGCLHEHGEFVRARLPNGYGLVEAAGTTLRRLHLHLADVANFEPLALVAFLAPLARPLRTRATGAALGLVVVHVLAYAPFYFDGNYPGGGARLLADMLPVEHALLVTVVVAIAARRAPGVHVTKLVLRASTALLAVALLGFAVHTAYAHGQLATRDGGRPMFEPDVLARQKLTQGLVFVDTDHGFGLAHVPGATTTTGVVVARLREDDHDGLLWERLGKPPTWFYKRGLEEAGQAPVPAALSPFTPTAPGPMLRFEAEADWPPLAQSGGFAVPAWTDACAGGSRALVLTPDVEGATATATIAVPVPSPGRYRITPRVVHGARVPFTAPSPPNARAPHVGKLRFASYTFEWTERAPSAPGGIACEDLGSVELALDAPAAHPEVAVVFEAVGGPIGLDRVVLERVP